MESKGKNYYPVVNFNLDYDNNDSPTKDKHKNAHCKETIRERRKECDLRPRDSKRKEDGCISIGGLAINMEPMPRMGRKSLLSKAQKQAILEIKQGKQGTISRALRYLGPRGTIK